MAHDLRLVSFNVNGLRPMLRTKARSLKKVLEDDLQADIICIQELKLSKKDMHQVKTFAMPMGWNAFFSFCTYDSSYSGVATFCKEETARPLAAEEGMTVYVPPVDDEGAERFEFKMRCLKVLRHRIESCLAAGRSVVVAGDLNIAPYPFDHDNFADAPAWVQEGMVDGRPDRVWLRELLQAKGGPLVDLHRHFHPATKQGYSKWSMAPGARKRNEGRRLDFVLAGSPGPHEADAGDPFVHKFTDAGILAHITGSDHAPVYADLQLPLPLPRGTSVPDLDLRNRRTGHQQEQQASSKGKKRKAEQAEQEPDTPPRPSAVDYVVKE